MGIPHDKTGPHDLGVTVTFLVWSMRAEVTYLLYL